MSAPSQSPVNNYTGFSDGFFLPLASLGFFAVGAKYLMSAFTCPGKEGWMVL